MREEFVNSIAKVIITDEGVLFEQKGTQVVIPRTDITKPLKYSMGGIAIIAGKKRYGYAVVSADKERMINATERFNQLLGVPLESGKVLTAADFEKESTEVFTPAIVTQAEKQLHPGEQIRLKYIAPLGVQNENGYVTRGETAVLFTDKRVIYAGKDNALFIRGDVVKTITYDTINDIQISKDMLSLYKLCIDTLKEKITFQGGKEELEELCGSITQIVANYKEQKTTAPVAAVSSMDELKKLKELLDIGIVTQEEFDAKKKQLLGL